MTVALPGGISVWVLALALTGCDGAKSVTKESAPGSTPAAASPGTSPVASTPANPSSLGSVVELTDANFQTEVLKSKSPVLVDFWAPWCGPCRMLNPTIQALAKDYAGKVKVGKLHTDHNPKTSTAYGIRSIPRVMLFKDGKVVQSWEGFDPSNPKLAYKKAIDAQLAAR